jgi:hypothetical protein
MDDVQSLIEELRFSAENGQDTELLERAADKIQELVADLGDADAMTEYFMKKNEWIRCEDRLPVPRTWVLVAYKKGVTIGMLHGYLVEPLHEKYYWRGVKGAKHALSSVTHWMPLPDAPEVEG